MKIIILGSTYVSELVANATAAVGHEISFVPSKNPIFAGRMKFAEVNLENLPPHDIKLSVQFDQKLTDLDRSYNLHTGLLPEYGGCDILYHTVANGERKQGLTLHGMTEVFDEGPIVSQITYPVMSHDTAVDLYKKMCHIAGPFAVAAISLLDTGSYPSGRPTMYYRGKVENQSLYETEKKQIQAFIDTQHA